MPNDEHGSYRNLILCCDGTNNQFGVENTNVVRLVQMLDRDPKRQIVQPVDNSQSHTQLLFYDPGVGTLPEPGVMTWFGRKLSEIMSLAFGVGLKRNVEEAYSFLMDFWEPGDRVFLFGFSRGAYTVRVLAGMLHQMGLLPRGQYNLVPYALRLFGAIRDEDEQDTSKYWRLCNEFRRTFARPVVEGDDSRRFPVHFVGVWDTVSSVGWVWDPVRYPFTARNPSIRTIRHAVSIDERRWFFRQNLFTSSGPNQDLLELWFPGVHADVGGGYPENEGGLWRASLEWMVDEAQNSGLLVDESRRQKVFQRTPPSAEPWSDLQHESLTAKWWPAEFFPKLRAAPGSKWRLPRMGLGRRRWIKVGAVLHRTTLQRIRSANYGPPNLAPRFLDKVRQLAEIPPTLAYEP